MRSCEMATPDPVLRAVALFSHLVACACLRYREVYLFRFTLCLCVCVYVCVCARCISNLGRIVKLQQCVPSFSVPFPLQRVPPADATLVIRAWRSKALNGSGVRRLARWQHLFSVGMSHWEGVYMFFDYSFINLFLSQPASVPHSMHYSHISQTPLHFPSDYHKSHCRRFHETVWRGGLRVRQANVKCARLCRNVISSVSLRAPYCACLFWSYFLLRSWLEKLHPE